MGIKSISWKGCVPLLALMAIPAALANDYYQPLDLPCYYAWPGPKQPRSQWWRRFYIAGKLGVTDTVISDIETVVINPSLPPPPAALTEATSTNIEGGAALGYQLRCSGIFSRLEIEYMNKGQVPYNPNPVIVFNVPPPVPATALTSTVDINTLLFKIYYDIDIGYQIFPYIQVGAGAAFEKVDSTGSFTNPFSTPIITVSTQSKTNFAADAGVGVHIKFSPHFFSDIGYEFDYLGSGLQWTLDTSTNNSTPPLVLQSGTIYANTLTFSLGWVI